MKYRFSMEIETLDGARMKPHEFEEAMFFALKQYCKKAEQTLILNDKSLEEATPVRPCRECAECGPYCDPNAYESCQKRKTDGSCWRRYEKITDAE